MDNKIHIGNLIRKELEEKERSVSWLAQKVHCDRSNLCKLLKKDYIDTNLLLRISIVLNFDFFACYTQHLYKQESIRVE